MGRILVLSAALLLSQTSFAQAQTSIAVDGKLSGGNFVSAVVTIGPNGQVSGSGVLYGVNPSTGTTYKYPFTITKLTTGKGTLTLTGTLAGAGFPVTLTTAVPNGPQVFSYVVNGKTYSLTGQGTVTIQ